MATTKEYADFICGCLRLVPELTCKKIFGEYGVYAGGKLFGLICDNRLLLKPTEAAQALLPNAKMELPYPGAKPMLLVEEVEDAEFLQTLAEQICAQLPVPKLKTKRKSAEKRKKDNTQH